MTGIHISWHSDQECLGVLLRRMALAMAAATTVQLPMALSIGTQRYFENGWEYRYTWNATLGGFVCDHQTSTRVPGEALAIFPSEDDDGVTWYVAYEGTLTADGDGFQARQGVFRTQEEFWEPGNHAWQLNSSSTSTNEQNTWDGSMNACTRVAANTPVVTGTLALHDAAGFEMLGQ